MTISFILIRLLPRELPSDKAMAEIMEARWEALGYGKPILTQYLIYLRGIFTSLDFGTSWYIDFRAPVLELLIERLPPTVIVNLLSLIVSIPIGIALGVWAALGKGRPRDGIISILIMIFVSVPSYVYAFAVQYLLGYSLGWFPITVYSLSTAGGWLTPKMIYSMIPAVIALSFGEVSGLARFTRAEMCEALDAEYMTFLRARGVSYRRAVFRHALKNALVPILPTVIASVIGILAGSVVIEEIFAIPGVGQLYIRAIELGDYDVFMMNTLFYTFLGLVSGLAVDLSYGALDPRIRIAEG